MTETPVAESIDSGVGNKKKEIYTYTAPWTVYSMAWRRRPEGRFQLAVGSFIEEYANQFHIIELKRDEKGSFVKLGQFDHPYPATKVAWAPAKLNLGISSNPNCVDIMATSGDYLRLWDVNSEYQVTMKGVLNNNKHTGNIISLNLTIFSL